MAEQDKKSLSEMKTTRWSITMWLTDGRDQETLMQYVQAMPSDWALEGQIEQGENSDTRLHAQLLLKTPQTRGTRIAKFFPQCHIEEARNYMALKQYVHKEETRVSEFKTVENKFPAWKEVRNRFADWFVKNKLEAHPFRLEDDYKMKFWDEFICISIREGMEVDVVGVNPQYRSCIMKYWDSYIECAVDRATLADPPSVDKLDRQTKDKELVADPLQSIFAPRDIACRLEGNPTAAVPRRKLRCLVPVEA